MIEREYLPYRLADGREELGVRCDLPGGEVLSAFLQMDAGAFAPELLELLERVLTGSSGAEEFDGNVCHAELGPERTRIEDMLSEPDESGSQPCCTVSTDDLKELVDDYLAQCAALHSGTGAGRSRHHQEMPAAPDTSAVNAREAERAERGDRQ